MFAHSLSSAATPHRARAKDGAAQLLIGEDEVLQHDLDRVRRRRRQAGKYAGTALTRERQRGPDVGRADHCGADDDGIGHHATCQLTHHFDCLGCGRRGVGRPEAQRGLALELDGVDRDDAGRTADSRALNGCGADPARADHHGCVAAAHIGAACCRAVSGGNRTRQRRGRHQGETRIDLDE